ncbi:hypothetical protein LEP1GSC073_1556 [Leptospira noguchii str. Cascata]|nr:hypothetical protein LEP1GSC073_1556 [Leptospira noguchii str. Cascata]
MVHFEKSDLFYKAINFRNGFLGYENLILNKAVFKTFLIFLKGVFRTDPFEMKFYRFRMNLVGLGILPK